MRRTTIGHPAQIRSGSRKSTRCAAPESRDACEFGEAGGLKVRISRDEDWPRCETVIARQKFRSGSEKFRTWSVSAREGECLPDCAEHFVRWRRFRHIRGEPGTQRVRMRMG